MKKRRKGGLTITTLMAFMVEMAEAGPCALSALMTQTEKMKYKPDNTPEPSTPACSSIALRQRMPFSHGGAGVAGANETRGTGVTAACCERGQQQRAVGAHALVGRGEAEQRERLEASWRSRWLHDSLHGTDA
eukprot:CAMPEP_0119098128 /NCGR_PEP_ID=MMETSP1178-20130426/184429_1 /TAXON_ID=33656 /ORGANISM="unid sp, Strain CCMP2000" /LENGTH=132 /DNA_ID=CAMNT_0007082101 /DNA_START=664 /DNA_END=1059 /DNA_ORIENTATION=-